MTSTCIDGSCAIQGEMPEWFKGIKETEQDIIEVLGLQTESLDSGIKKIVQSLYTTLEPTTTRAFEEVKKKLKSIGVEVGKQLKSFQLMASGNTNTYVIQFEFMPIKDIIKPYNPTTTEIPTSNSTNTQPL